MTGLKTLVTRRDALPGINREPIAASLSIKPFEVSRWRLRRTRQPPVCVFNRVLVLKTLCGRRSERDPI